MKSRVIALSAISAAFVALFLTLGAYFSVIDMLAVVAASIFVVLPMYYGSKKGCALAYLAGGVLAFMFGGFNVFTVVFPAYFAYFGLIPVLNAVADGKLKRAVWTGIKLVWFVVVLFGLLAFYVYVMKMPIESSFDLFGRTFDFSAINGFIYIFLAAYLIVGLLVFLLFEKFTVVSRALTDRLLGKILKK